MNASKTPLTDRAVLHVAAELLRRIEFARAALPGHNVAPNRATAALNHLGSAATWVRTALTARRSPYRDELLANGDRAIEAARDGILDVLSTSYRDALDGCLRELDREQDAADRAEKFRPGV